MRENIEQFESFCDMLVEIGVDELTFNQLGGFDRPEFYGENRLLDYQVKKFLKDLPVLKEKFLKMGLKIHGGSDYLRRIVFSTEDKKIPIDECRPGSWFWFINENGFVSPCSYTSYEYKLHSDSIQSVEDIRKSEEHFSNLRKTNRSHWCDDCHCTQLYDKFE
jgi:radical SAM protein with 4Fe4S-binding SPASM domain